MRSLAEYTLARVGLGSAGGSLPTAPLLELRLEQARAKDAVHQALDSHSLAAEMKECGFACRTVHSSVKDRDEYLRRPDKGRKLDENIEAEVRSARRKQPFVIVVADGLSSLAVHRYAIPLLQALLRGSNIPVDQDHPIWIAQQARVALGDQLGELLDAELSLVLIGERPGLSTPDSLGAYLTWQPRVGRQDSERNCVSNIHTRGLSYQSAAHKINFLIQQAWARRLTGIALKEEASKLIENS